MTPRRVVVTGLGIVSSVGVGKDLFWSSLLEGRSGIRPIQRFDASNYSSRMAGEVSGFDPLNYLTARETPKMAPVTQYAMAAAKMAVGDAQLDLTQAPGERVAVAIGTGLGGMGVYEEQLRILIDTGNPRRIHPWAVPLATANAAAAEISIAFGITGPNMTISTACSSGAHAVGYGLDLIRLGRADKVIAGGAEACLLPGVFGAFCSLRVLSSRNDAPERASRPFDRKRDGFVMGEGAAVLILEEYDAARRRGAPIYAEVAGYGLLSEAAHMVSPDLSGSGQARVMSDALRDAGLSLDEVDYINTHGTSTLTNDLVETRAIKMLFGQRAHQISANATKSMLGHTIGAAGAIEAVVCALTLKHGLIHPTVNLEEPDPECDLDYTPNKARERRVKLALSNSFGFGSNNACLAMKAV
ncbi:MAG: beta-ketoacyl-ACP synthase II [Nitrospirae bacterium]|nr:beta-ketoacyl-ACP synthase II [Candidatus Manganitrophaceae bacterium]